jgi:hypothetical protein
VAGGVALRILRRPRRVRVRRCAIVHRVWRVLGALRVHGARLLLPVLHREARQARAVTRGRRALLAVLQIITAQEVAARVRVHKSNVSRWASGEWKPSRRARIMLAAHLRIPAEEWAEPPRGNGQRARSFR